MSDKQSRNAFSPMFVTLVCERSTAVMAVERKAWLSSVPSRVEGKSTKVSDTQFENALSAIRVTFVCERLATVMPLFLNAPARITSKFAGNVTVCSSVQPSKA